VVIREEKAEYDDENDEGSFLSWHRIAAWTPQMDMDVCASFPRKRESSPGLRAADSRPRITIGRDDVLPQE
jgi:hypothetical protein